MQNCWTVTLLQMYESSSCSMLLTYDTEYQILGAFLMQTLSREWQVLGFHMPGKPWVGGLTKPQ